MLTVSFQSDPTLPAPNLLASRGITLIKELSSAPAVKSKHRLSLKRQGRTQNFAGPRMSGATQKFIPDASRTLSPEMQDSQKTLVTGHY